MNNSNSIILIFIITAAWDIILRFMALGELQFGGIENMRWVTTLKPYFERHTLLAAALIAGFVGAITRWLILILPYPKQQLLGIVWLFVLSGLVGIPMRHSGLFPHLEKYYYDPLGELYSFITDGLSGLIVGGTYAFFVNFVLKNDFMLNIINVL